MKQYSRIRQLGEAFLVCLALLFIPWIPRRLLVAMARGLGYAAYRMARRERRVALANLELAFRDRSPAEREAIARNSFRSFALLMLDLFWFSVRSHTRIARHVHFDPSFDAYLQTQGPLMAITAHLGNWEVMGQRVALAGKGSVSVAAPLVNPFVDRILTRMRSTTGQTIAYKQGAMRAMMKALKDGGRVGLLLDQNTLPRDGGIYVNLFGRPVPMSGAASSLSLRTHAAIVLTYCVPDVRGEYTAYARPAFKPADGVSAEALTQRVADMLQVVITQNAGHWLWMYKRWKYIPAGMSADGFPYYAHTEA
jgi:KDO2-lipid IV(A) lauroyltransferase